jgi:hypothetical protein
MQQEQARRPPARPDNIENRARQPVLWVPPTAPESAIERTRSGAEQRARTTATAILTAAQNGTSGALADDKHVRRRAIRTRGICVSTSQGGFCLLGLRNRSGRPLYDGLDHPIIHDPEIDTIPDQVRSNCIATAVLGHNPCRLM